MRLLLRISMGFVICVLLIFLFMPPLVGIALQRSGNYLFAGESDYFNIEILKYERGWFSSDVTFKIKGTPALISRFQKFSTPTLPLPPNFDLVMKGHIQQGPLFYSAHPNNPPLGLALMTRQFIPTEEQKNLFNLFSVNLDNIKQNSSYLNFMGEYKENFEIQNLRLTTPEGIRIELKAFQINLGSFQNNLQGEINLHDFSVADDNTSILLPHTRLDLNLQKYHGLWLGDQSLSISSINLKDGGEEVQLSQIQFKGTLSENKGLLSGDRDLNIQTLQFNNQTLGPIQLRVSVNHLNAKAILDLINTYQDITTQGEMYESQLRQKMLMLVPGIIGPDSTLSLDKLSVQTQEGSLIADAKAYWPIADFSAQSNVQDLAEAASLKANFKISLPLANKIIALLAQFTYVYQIPNEDQAHLFELQNAIRLSTQINAYSILELIEAGEIPREEGIDLLTKIRSNIAVEEYVEEVKKLLLIRKIDLLTSYELNFLYTMLYQQYSEFDQKIFRQQKNTEQSIRNQLNQYLKEGLIVQDNDEYQMSLTREKSKLIINGKLRSHN